MGADELLRELSRRGVAVWVDDKKLRFRAPAGALTEGPKHDIPVDDDVGRTVSVLGQIVGGEGAKNGR